MQLGKSRSPEQYRFMQTMDFKARDLRHVIVINCDGSVLGKYLMFHWDVEVFTSSVVKHYFNGPYTFRCEPLPEHLDLGGEMRFNLVNELRQVVVCFDRDGERGHQVHLVWKHRVLEVLRDPEIVPSLEGVQTIVVTKPGRFFYPYWASPDGKNESSEGAGFLDWTCDFMPFISRKEMRRWAITSIQSEGRQEHGLDPHPTCNKCGGISKDEMPSEEQLERMAFEAREYLLARCTCLTH